jgi:hypothetical protein
MSSARGEVREGASRREDAHALSESATAFLRRASQCGLQHPSESPEFLVLQSASADTLLIQQGSSSMAATAQRAEGRERGECNGGICQSDHGAGEEKWLVGIRFLYEEFRD